MEGKVSGGGTPGGLPLISRFSQSHDQYLEGQTSPQILLLTGSQLLRTGTLFLVNQ